MKFVWNVLLLMGKDPMSSYLRLVSLMFHASHVWITQVWVVPALAVKCFVSLICDYVWKNPVGLDGKDLSLGSV